MNRTVLGVLYALVMVAVVVVVDLAFLRGAPWLRLGINIAIVAAFGAVYLLVVRRP